MRKKIFRTLCAAVIAGTMLVVPASAEAAIVMGDGVNFRSGPGTNYNVIATIDSGAEVNVTDRSNPSWYAVSCAGCSGFISSSYLNMTGDSPAAAPDFTPPPASGSGNTGYINAMYVRFRSGPSSAHSVLGEYNKGKEVTVVGSEGGWTACYIDGQPGYIYSQYISGGSFSGFTPPAPAEQSPAAGGGIPENPGYGLPMPDGYYQGSSAAPGNPVLPNFTPPVPAPTQQPVPMNPEPGTQQTIPAASPEPSAAPAETPAPDDEAVPTPVPTEKPEVPDSVPGYILGTYVRFRSGPGTNYSILGSYNTGKTIGVVGDAGNGWYRCIIDDVLGYVYGNYVLINNEASFKPGTGSAGSSGNKDGEAEKPEATEPPVEIPQETEAPEELKGREAYITGNNVRFRSGPSMTSAILGEFFYGNKVLLMAVQGDWAQVSYEGTPGFVYASYVKEGSYSSGTEDNSGAEESGSPSTPAGSATGQNVANYALQFVGYNYCWGGASPETGFDCSGLVYYVYRQFGYTLNRVANDQARNGVHVEPSELQPGDVLCFYSGSSYIGHAGIYIGDGKFVHASNSTTGVIISELSGHYSTRGFEARRIIA
ncbi:MAG: SH3 domain-containing protein [Candidatus Limivicinus sp.]|jgi:N-acetylmuramoyl-L-alanine amidase